MWGLADPLIRLERYMKNKGIWHIDEEKLTAEYKSQIDAQFTEAENNKSYPWEDMFGYMYTDMPDELKRQKAEYQQFLSWKEGAG